MPELARTSPDDQAVAESRTSPFVRYTIEVSLKLYVITCELLHPGDYRSFKERLRTLNAKQLLANQWAVRTQHTADELKELVRGFLADEDRVVVTEVGEERASRRALANIKKL